MFGLFKKTTKFYAPLTGKVVDLSQVPDEAFSDHIIGNGAAIMPDFDVDGYGTVVTPVAGVVEMIFRTNHAFGMKMADGTELIVHIGVDTVKLNGECFERLLEEGSQVEAGVPVIKVNFKAIAEKEIPIVTPLIITSPTEESDFEISIGSTVVAGKDVMMQLKK